MSDLEKTIREGFERVDRRFDSLEGRADRLDKKVQKLDKEVNTKLDAIALNLKSIERHPGKRITELERRVDNLEGHS